MLTLFQIESASCLLPPGVPSFWLYAFVVLAVSTTILGSLALCMHLFDKANLTKTADRTEFILTVLFATLLVYTLQVISAVLRAQGYLAQIAQAIAIPLLFLLIALVLRFWFKVELIGEQSPAEAGERPGGSLLLAFGPTHGPYACVSSTSLIDSLYTRRDGSLSSGCASYASWS